MALLELDRLPCPVRLERNKRARRYTLRLDKTGTSAVLVMPDLVPDSEALAFLDRHSDWLRRALADRRPKWLETGAELPVDGEIRRIEFRRGARRAPKLDGPCLTLQGRDEGAVAPMVQQWLKLRARNRLDPAARDYAALLGRSVARVSFRDTRSRWGSCSSTGSLSFSWRLAMAPPEVQKYVAAHEAAHLVEMNHSPRFWAVVEGLMPGWRTQRDWLKTEGRKLHDYRFDKPQTLM